MTLIALPPESLSQILSKVSNLHSLLTNRLVCRRFNNLIVDLCRLKRSLVLSTHYPSTQCPSEKATQPELSDLDFWIDCYTGLGISKANAITLILPTNKLPNGKLSLPFLIHFPVRSTLFFPTASTSLFGIVNVLSSHVQALL